MKNETATAAKAPEHSWKDSTAVPVPYRHESSGRTVGREQTADQGNVHLFSATGLFIATVPADKAKADSDAAVAAAKADRDAADKANEAAIAEHKKEAAKAKPLAAS